MKKLITLLIMTVLILVYFIGYTEQGGLGLQNDGRVVTETSEGWTPETLHNNLCSWAMTAVGGGTLEFAKRMYYKQCNDPKFEYAGQSLLTYAVLSHKPEMVEWLVSIPGMNVNHKFSGQTVLYSAIVFAHRNHVGQGGKETEETDIQIVKLLLEHGADTMLPNDTEGHGNFSNGSSAYDFVKNPMYNFEDSEVGRLVIRYTKGKQ